MHEHQPQDPELRGRPAVARAIFTMLLWVVVLGLLATFFLFRFFAEHPVPTAVVLAVGAVVGAVLLIRRRLRRKSS